MGAFELSKRLLRVVKSVEVAWEIVTDIWRRFPMSIGVFSVLFSVFVTYFVQLCLLRIPQGKPRLGGTQGDAP